MKNLLLLFSLLLVCYNCSNNDDGDSLPPITQTGANTVGCLVNGKVFLPKQEGINPSVNCFYQFIDGEFYFTMNFSDLRGTGFKEVFIQTAQIDLEDNKTHILNKAPDNLEEVYGRGGYSESITDNYYTNSINFGELTITRVDTVNSIISGTFWFDAINVDNEVVEIREGRFDWNY